MTRRLVLALLCLSMAVVGCSDEPQADPTEAFRACAERHGVEIQDLTLSVGDDGSIEVIAISIISEGDVPYEPLVRLACIEEAEAS